MGTGRLRRIALAVVVAATVVWWFESTPPSYMQIGPAIDFGDVPEAIASVEAPTGSLQARLERIDSKVPGHDDLLVWEDEGVAFVSGMDGWIWRVLLESGEADAFADVPLMPSGLRRAPSEPNVIYFCASHLHGTDAPPGERVGLYRLLVPMREVSAIVTEVPLTPAIPDVRHKVYADGDPSAPSRSASTDDGGSRPLAFCNDLDVSRDGKRIYFTEPIAYEGAAMGGGAIGEAITLGDNGRLWRHDLETNETRLIADGFHFIDGILVDDHPDDAREASVLVTQTPGFAITRFFISGPRAGTHESVWASLPGMPDGMDRDAQGRIWVGLFRKRTAFLTWAHANPWIKPLLLRLPLDLLPVPKETGILGLSADGAMPIYYAMYEGPILQDAAVVVPGDTHLYVANFREGQQGLVRMPYPELVASRVDSAPKR